MKNDIKNLVKCGNSLLSEEMKNNGFGFYICVGDDEYYTDINNKYNVYNIDEYDFYPIEITCMYFMWAEEVICSWEQDELRELTEQQMQEFVKNIIVEYDGVKNNKFLNFKPNGYCPVYY